jgi:hypothetical protein
VIHIPGSDFVYFMVPLIEQELVWLAEGRRSAQFLAG